MTDVKTVNRQDVESRGDIYENVQAELLRQFSGRSVSKILLISPPDGDQSLFDFQTAKRGRYWNYPPYGLGVIATHLQNDGFSVEILNLNNIILEKARRKTRSEDFDFSICVETTIARAMANFEPDLVGVTCMFAQTHQSLLDVCAQVKAADDRTPIAVGGVHITNSFIGEQTRLSLLKGLKDADFLFCYESELAFRDFVRAVNNNDEMSELGQVVFNNTTPRLFFADRGAPVEKDLNVAPAHDLMRSSDLSRNGKIGGFYSLLKDGAPITTVLSNRGCRAQCTFCSVRNFNGVGVRRRSVQSVIDELLDLRHDHGIEHIMWLDDDFLYNAKESLHLFSEMIRQDVGLTWDCTNGVIAASCTDEVMQAAAESGCIGLTVGMESGNPEILKAIRKPGNVENFLNAAEVLRGIEQINARVFLMIGFPGETYRQIMDTVDVGREMGLDWYNVTILQPLPNTPIFNQMVSEGLIGDVDFSDIRYNSGQYGKHRKMAEKARDPLAADFKDAFANADMDQVPDRAELDDIWAYMNFHLNFRRLFLEERPAKLLQQLRYVDNIARLVAPNNAFATYFSGYLGYKTRGQVDPKIVDQLEAILDASPYWRDRCSEFQLSPQDLKTLNFDRHRDALAKANQSIAI